jgi:hypothetical protein
MEFCETQVPAHNIRHNSFRFMLSFVTALESSRTSVHINELFRCHGTEVLAVSLNSARSRRNEMCRCESEKPPVKRAGPRMCPCPGLSCVGTTRSMQQCSKAHRVVFPCLPRISVSRLGAGVLRNQGSNTYIHTYIHT